MAATSVATIGSSGPAPSLDPQTSLYLRILTIWHLTFAVGSLGGVVYLWVGEIEIAPWMRLLASVLLGLGAVASLFVSFYIRRRLHRGRMISLLINYLGFVICLLWGFHVIGVYTGIDSLAGTFGRGLPYLGVAFIGYLIGAFGARYEETRPGLTRQFNQVGKIFGAAGGVLFLIAVGIIPGLLSALSKFNAFLPFALFTGVLVLGILIWMMGRAPTARALGARSDDDTTLNGFLFLSPNLLGFLVLLCRPLDFVPVYQFH